MQECAHCANFKYIQDASTRPGYMLPTDVVPFDLPGQPGYKITLEPEIKGDNPHFKGEVTIAINVLNPGVKEFPINSVDLDLEHVWVMDNTELNPIWQRPRLRQDADNQRVWLCFDQELAQGPGVIVIKYSGQFNKQLKGFYLSHDKNAKGEPSLIAVPQSEPADFRRWVPSFDQPNLKSTFEVTAVVDSHLTVRSNGHIVSEDSDGLTKGKKRVRFAVTNKLPTYVVAVVLGELESSDPIIVSGVEIRIWAAPGSKHLMNFALKVIERGLPLLEEFHGVKYPNKKLDMVAVQEFAAGAMENDGLFTFRRDILLIDETNATLAELVKAASTILHEMDHTWDGNRITMVEWKQLPLNELRATYMSYLIADIMYPQWDIWTRFAQLRAEAMEADGLTNTRAIVSPVDRLDEVESLFDVITYRKGASVLRQGQTCLDQISAGGFKRGMQYFNSLYGGGNATTEQLWDAIGEKSDYDFSGFMDPWMSQPGFPMVMVTRAGDRSVKISQARIKYLNVEADQGPEQLWQIPLFVRIYAKGKATEQLLFLNEREQTFNLGVDFDWLVVNAGGHGFYRVQYSDAMVAGTSLLDEVANHANHLLTELTQVGLTPIERFNLLNDAWAFLQAGTMTVVSYLNLVNQFRGENDPMVWKIIATSLTRLSHFAPEAALKDLQSFMLDLTYGLSWSALKSQDTPQEWELKGIKIGMLGSQCSQFSWLYEEARNHAYIGWERNIVNADVLAAAVKSMAHAGNEDLYLEFLNHLKHGKREFKFDKDGAGRFGDALVNLTPQQETMFQEALCCFPDEKLAGNTLTMIRSGEIKPEMSGILIKQLLQNPAVRDVTWRFVKDHFAELKAKLPSNLFFRGLEGIRWLDKPGDTQDISDLFAGNTELIKGHEKPIAQTCEWQAINAAFRQRCTAELSNCHRLDHWVNR